jgi:hypothetical protein
MKNYKSFFVIYLVILIVLAIYYYFTNKYMSEYFSNKNYKFVTSGTCASHSMRDLTKGDCSRYLLKSNYTITEADHGPPGCWLVLGEMLNQTMNEQPQFAGKGFACWSKNHSDNKQCSSDIPCICKN